MLRSIRVVLMLTLALPFAGARADGDVRAGAQKSRTLQCQTCHGKDGLAKVAGAPNLAGQPSDYLVASLNAYRSGERKNDMMSAVAQPLKDTDIADVAAYFSAIEVTVKVPNP